MSRFMTRLALLPVVVLAVACGTPDDKTDFDAEDNENAVSQMLAANDDSDTATAPSEQVINPGSDAVDVYAGYCSGSAMQRIATAYFMSPQLAITSGSLIGSRTSVCLARGTTTGIITYYDVHAIRTHFTGGYGGLAGLSLMRASGESHGFDVVTGSLVGSGTMVEGAYPGTSNSGGTTYTAVGPAVASDAFTGTMHADTYPYPNPPAHLHFRGGGAVYLSGSEHPIGVQWAVTDAPTGNTLSERYIFRRNQQNDVAVVDSWNAQSAPAKTITITSIAHNSIRTGGWGPAEVLVQQNPVLPYTIELDGVKYVPGTKILYYPPVGWHTLSVYLTDHPQFRHTIRFLQQ
jgi:hypothetical protein